MLEIMPLYAAKLWSIANQYLINMQYQYWEWKTDCDYDWGNQGELIGWRLL